MKILGTIGLALTGVLALAACGDSSGAGGAGGGTGSTTTSGTGSTTKAATTTTGTPTSTGTSAGGTGKIGDACAVTGDCIDGYFCAPPPDDPGGQCLKVCAAQADCPMGSTCTDEHKCYKSCTGAAGDCPRPGYACVDSMTVTNTATKTCDVADTGTTSSTGAGN